MRIIATIISIGFAFTSHASAEGPINKTKPADTPQAKVAITYLNLLSAGELDLTKHTAISKHCGAERRKSLLTRIDLLRKNYFHENDSLTVETQQINTRFAGVLIRAENPAAPLSTRIHAVALIKKEDTWQPAPIPGSFSNTGYGYDEEVEQSVRALERWMTKEKILRESQYREKATSSLKSKLIAIEKKAGFDKMEPKDAMMYFMEQCREKNLLGILASMGWAPDNTAESMENLIDIVSQGLNHKGNGIDWWPLLTSRSVIARILETDQKRKEVVVGFYNPMKRAGHETYEILRFPFRTSNGKTFISLSPLLKIALLPEADRKRNRWQHNRANDRELRNQLPAAIFKNIEASGHPSSEILLEQFLTALKKDDFTKCIRLLPLNNDYFGKEENHKSILSDIGNLWQHAQKLDHSQPHTCDIIKENNVALAPIQYAQNNRVGELQTVEVWMIKDDDGWHLITYNILNESLGKELTTTAGKIKKRFLASEKKLQNEHARNLLDKVITVTLPPKLKAVLEADAKKLFSSYRTHLRAKDTQAALSSCAVVDETSSAQTLKTLGYALKGAADHTDDDHLMGTSKKGPWIGLSVRTSSKVTKLNDYPLYLIINTTKGPRILLDVDLRHPSNKGRELINKKNWRKLEEILPAESLNDLKTIFEKHLELCTKDAEEIHKLRN